MKMHTLFSGSEHEARLLFRTLEKVGELSNALVGELREQDAETNKVKTILESLDKEGDEPAILEAFRTNVNGLNEKIHTQIDINLEKLEKEATLAPLQSRLLSLKAVMLETKNAAKPDEKPPFMTQVGDSLEHATEAVLPKEWIKNMDRNQKIATAVAGTAGVIVAGVVAWQLVKLIANRISGAVGDGQEAAKNANGGWLKKFLIGTGIGLAALLGVKWYFDGTWKRVIEGGIDAAKNIAGNAKEGLENRADRKEPWLKYALTEAQYKEARTVYRSRRIHAEEARPEIEKIFQNRRNVHSDAKSLEDFLADMQELYRVEPRESISHAHAEVAIENYNDEFDKCVNGMKEYIRTHQAETGIAALIAWRLRLTGLAFDATKMTASETKDFAQTLMEIGYKHPLLSLLAAGGTLVALEGAAQASENAWLPETLTDLQTAGNKKMDVAKDLALTEQQKAELRTLMTALKGLDLKGINAQYFAEQIGNIVKDLPDRLANFVGLTSNERNHIVNFSSITSLESHLNDLLKDATHSHEGTANTAAVENAHVALAELKDSLDKYRLNTVTDNNAPVQALEKLRSSLAPLNIQLEIKNGIVSWIADGEKVALCADPSLTTEGAINSASENIRSGSWSSDALLNFILTARLLQQDAMERGISSSKPVAMISGNLLYLFDPTNAFEIAAIPLGTLGELGEAFWGGITEGDWSVDPLDASNIYARTIAFYVGAETVARITSILAGGRGFKIPIPRSPLDIGKLLASPITQPVGRGVGAVRWSRNAWNAYASSGLDFFDSRFALQLMERTHFSASFIRQVETESGEGLRKIATNQKVTLSPGDTDDIIRSKIRERLIQKIETEKITRLSRPHFEYNGTKLKGVSMSTPVDAKDAYSLLTKASGVEVPKDIIEQSFAGTHAEAARKAAGYRTPPVASARDLGQLDDIIDVEFEIKPNAPSETPNQLKIEYKPETADSTAKVTNAASESADDLARLNKELAEHAAAPASDDTLRGLVETLESPVAKHAIANGDEGLKAMSKAAQNLKFLRSAALPCTLGAVISGALICQNEADILNAEADGDRSKAEILRMKRVSLSVEAGVSIISAGLVIAGPIGWALIAGQVVVSLSNEVMYARCLQYAKEDEDYLQEHSLTLLQNIKHWSNDRFDSSVATTIMAVRTLGNRADFLNANAAVQENSLFAYLRKNLAVSMLTPEAAFKIVAGQHRFLKARAKERGGNLANLLPEDFEMADFYGELLAILLENDDEHDTERVEARLRSLEQKFKDFGINLPSLSGVPREEVPSLLEKVLYNNYDRNWEESNVAWALRSEKVVELGHDAMRMKELLEKDPSKKDQVFQLFKNMSLDGCLKHHIGMAVAALENDEREALDTYVTSRLHLLFENLMTYPTTDDASLHLRMYGEYQTLQAKLSEAAQSEHFNVSSDPSSPYYSASHEATVRNAMNANMGGR